MQILNKKKKTNYFPFSKKAVLVTGASSGIGFAISTYLAEKGFLVFATIRKESDLEKLKNLNLSNLIPVYPLDLTNSHHINSVFEFVSEEIDKKEQKAFME